MDTPAPRRSTRSRPAKPPLSEDAILDVATRILRTEGLEAVTMRRLATELDTGAASLYVYISGRDALRSALLDRIAGQIPVRDPDPEHWREQVHALMKGFVDAMSAHPGIAMVAVANPPTGEGSLLIAENLLATLRAGGVRDADAAWAADILALVATASAIEADAQRARGDQAETEEELVARLDSAFSALSPERFPNIVAIAPLMTSGTGDLRFRFAIDVILDGLAARAG